MEGCVPDSRLCLNMSTLDSVDLETQLRLAREAGFTAVGLREKHVEAFLERGGTLRDVRRLLDLNRLTAVEYNYFPNWTCAGSDAQAILRRFAAFCEAARALGCSIVVAPTGCETGDAYPDCQAAVSALRGMAGVADEYGLTVGVEFLPWTPCNSVGRAWELVRSAGRANVGIVLDAFHFFEGPSTETELRQVPDQAICLVHVNDVEEVDAGLIARCREHRVLPGDGIYPLPRFLSQVREHQYEGYYSLEAMSTGCAAREPAELAKASFASMRRLLGG